MENACGVCFQQQGELFQVPGYPVPTCLKCSEQIAKGRILVTMNPGTNVVQATLQQPTTIPSSTTSTSTININQLQEQLNTTKNNKQVRFDLEQTLQVDSELLFGDDASCPICNKSFGRKSSLLNHIRNHSADRKYICSFCQKGFTQAANLRNHERIHTNTRPYLCIDCGKAFTQITNLNNHRRLHTGERPFVCIENECGRSFAQVTNLNNHMKTHHKVQQYVCNQCPSRFTQVSQLNLHLTTHGGLRGLVCPQCPEKTFKQQGQLQQHLKTHGIEFPYACGRCDEKFIQFVHLEHHMKMHEEFRFKCTMCSSSFNQEVLLKKHIQRHIDGRFLTCPVEGCNEGFTIKHHLTRHMQTHHSINNYTKRISVKRLKMSSYCRSAASGKYNCYFESCDESFGDADILNHHLRNVHGLSIVKNAGKRSKMDLMLLDQMKQQQQQNASNSINYAVEGDSSKRSVLTASQMVIDDQSRKQLERKAQLALTMQQIECKDPLNPDVQAGPYGVTARPQQQVPGNGLGYQVVMIKQEPQQQLLTHHQQSQPLPQQEQSTMKAVCSYCYNVFKTQQALARHMQKFHA